MHRNWKDSIIHELITVDKAKRIVEESAMNLVIYADLNNKLIGIITQGDIRKGLLKGVSGNDSCEKILNISPKSIQIKDKNEKTIMDFFLDSSLMHLPVINEAGILIDVEYYDEHLKINDDHCVVIMAGGKGERLRPLTNQIPKPLLKIGSETILDKIIDNCVRHGFNNIFISVNYKAEMIEKYYMDYNKWDCNIHFLREDKPLGTAGSISLLRAEKYKTLLVINGDLVTNINLQDMMNYHFEENAAATMGIRKHSIEIPYGVIKINESTIMDIEEKPEKNMFVNAGVYLLQNEVLKYIEKNSYLDMTDLFKILIQNKIKTAVFPIHEYWQDIGQLKDYNYANGNFSK